MKTNIILTGAILAWLLPASITAQPVCSPPPDCIKNSSFAGTVSGWFESHGFPAYSTNNAPDDVPGTGSLSMQASTTIKQGAFACYNFIPGQHYRVCFWARDLSASPAGGTLYVYATRGRTPMPGGIPPPAGVPKQLLGQYTGGNSAWEFYSFSFIPTASWNQLWLNADNNTAVVFDLEIDGIKISDDMDYDDMVYHRPDDSTINSCFEPVPMFIENVPAFATVTWTPDDGLTIAGSDLAYAQPCSTTTYEITVTDQGASGACAKCLSKKFYQTVVVDPVGKVLANTAEAPVTLACGEPLGLSFDPAFPCSTHTYVWKDPSGNILGNGTSVVVSRSVSTLHSGTYILEVTTANGCVYELPATVTVASCCVASPDFTTSGTNPVQFTNTSTGNQDLVSYYWTFGDGGSSSAKDPVHSFSTGTDREYTVCLTTVYRDPFGESCCQRECKQVQVTAASGTCAVNAHFTHSFVPGRGYQADFEDHSSGTGVICEYLWNWGDGSSPQLTTSPKVSHKFPGIGRYNVCLSVKNCIYISGGIKIDSCTAMYCETVVIPSPAPAAALSEEQDERGYQVSLFPNPAQQVVFIHVNGTDPKKVVIRNIHGAIVGRATEAGNGLFTFDTSPLAAGMYFAEVTGNSDRKKVLKFIRE